jgi:hypothetical protein
MPIANAAPPAHPDASSLDRWLHGDPDGGLDLAAMERADRINNRWDMFAYGA